jgi:hypothetical protein
METRQTPIAQFTTNSFVGNPIGVILLGTAAGMGLMMVGTMLGAPIVITMVLLFSGIGLVYGFMIGKVRYSLFVDGIEQKIHKFIPYYLSKKEETRFVAWQHIKSYKNDTDFSRQMREYEYIKLYLFVPPKEVWITNQIDNAGFQRFKEAFLLKMTEFAPAEEVTRFTQSIDERNGTEGARSVNAASSGIEIKRRKSFYKTRFARFITLFFIAVCCGLVWYGILNGMRFTNWFRLAIILVPGTIYMVYRVFIRSNH